MSRCTSGSSAGTLWISSSTIERAAARTIWAGAGAARPHGVLR